MPSTSLTQFERRVLTVYAGQSARRIAELEDADERHVRRVQLAHGRCPETGLTAAEALAAREDELAALEALMRTNRSVCG